MIQCYYPSKSGSYFFPDREIPSVGGLFSQTETTFFVEEIPLYVCSGEGEHLFIEFEKQGISTQEVLKRLKISFGSKGEDVGYAGLKDRHATTRQWLSIRGLRKETLESKPLEGLNVIQSEYHGNKLRTGHLRGNRFSLAISLDELQHERLQAWIDVLRRFGFPNYFGPQRFGAEENNAEQGRLLVLGQNMNISGWKRKFLVSCYQAFLFNQAVIMRIKQGWFDQTMVGDLLLKHVSGGRFYCEDLGVEQTRMDNLEISPTACLPGYKVKWAKGLAGKWEQEILDKEGLSAETFRPFGKIAQGTRRSIRVFAYDIELERNGEVTWFRFSLPPGAYASVLLESLGIEWALSCKAL